MAAATTGDTLLLDNLERVTAGLEQCQAAIGDGYLSGFPSAEFAQMEDFPAPPYAWVPYYVMHKIIAGLLDYRRHLGSARALSVAVRLAEHLLQRMMRMMARGTDRWFTFINQETTYYLLLTTYYLLLTTYDLSMVYIHQPGGRWYVRKSHRPCDLHQQCFVARLCGTV